jgi:hypothetical protein
VNPTILTSLPLASRPFGDDALDDRARDATAETLVDMKLTKHGVGEQADISPVACAHDRVDDDDDDDGTRQCTSCKQYLSAERFPGAHRKTCATCLRRNERNAIDDASRSRAQRLVSTPSMTARK